MTTEKNSTENHGNKYRAHPAISQSDLIYLHSPRLFKQRKEQQQLEPKEDYQHFGTMFDLFILDKEKFQKEYFLVPDLTTPNSPNKTKFVDLILQDKKLGQPVDIYEIYPKCYKVSKKSKESGEYKNDADELYKELEPYIDFIEESDGKKLYNQKEHELLTNMEISCQQHPVFRRFFYEPKFGDIIIKHKQIVDVELFGIQWKGELDHILIDEVNRVVYSTDLKSTGKKLASFPYYYRVYNYHKQQALYELLLKHFLKATDIVDFNDPWYINTRCAAVEKINLNEAGMFLIPQNVLSIGREELREDARKIKFYDEHGWEYTESFHKNNGLEVPDWNEVFD